MKSRVVVIVWVLTLVALFAPLLAYSADAGVTGEPPETLGALGVVEPAGGDRWTLVVFAHPRCPCTRATMEEFKRFHGMHRQRIETTLVLYVPKGTDPSWTRGAVASSVEGIDGVETLTDPGGALARRAGVATSGHVLAYDGTGTLRYSGGITASRGHEGLSEGRRTLAQLVRGGDTPGAETHAVYGCSLHDPDALCLDTGCLGVECAP